MIANILKSTDEIRVLHVSLISVLKYIVIIFTARCYRVDYAVVRCRPTSVRPLHAGFLSKRLNISSNFFSPSGSYTILVFPIPNGMAILRREPPTTLTVASNAESMKTRSSAVAERPHALCVILLSHLSSLKIIRKDAVEQGVHV